MPDELVQQDTVTLPRGQGAMISTISEEMVADSSNRPAEPNGSAEDGTDPEKAKNIENRTDKDKPSDDSNKKPETEDKLSGEEERFDKNPIFRELNKRIRKAEERAIRAEERAETLLKVGGKQEKDEQGFNVLDLSPEEIRAKLNDPDEDPRDFLANFARQVAAEVEGRVKEGSKTETFKERQMKTLQGYADENPDFIEKWESGEIGRYMQENPGHTAISAHAKITEPARMKKAIDEAVEKAIKETREEERRNAQARGKARVLKPGPSGPPRESGDETILKDTSKAGGRTRAIAQMLKTFRAGKGA